MLDINYTSIKQKTFSVSETYRILFNSLAWHNIQYLSQSSFNFSLFPGFALSLLATNPKPQTHWITCWILIHQARYSLSLVISLLRTCVFSS